MKHSTFLTEERSAIYYEKRWQQRLDNLKRAFKQLGKFIQKGELNELERQGAIKPRIVTKKKPPET